MLANDTDAESDPLTAALWSGAGSRLRRARRRRHVPLRPRRGFSGTDSFSYRVSDGRTTSAIATVTVTVRPPNRAPYAVEDYYYVDTGAMLDIADVLGNDIDDDGDVLAAQVERAPLNGELLRVAGNGRFLYRSYPGFVGTDVFSYIATDPSGARSAPAFVTIRVAAPVIAPPPPFVLPSVPASPALPLTGLGQAAPGMRLRRAALSDGRLDVLAEINAGATGAATVSFVARGVTTRMSVPIADGQIRVRRRLPARQRGAKTGIVKVAYARQRPHRGRRRRAVGRAAAVAADAARGADRRRPPRHVGHARARRAREGAHPRHVPQRLRRASPSSTTPSCRRAARGI